MLRSTLLILLYLAVSVLPAGADPVLDLMPLKKAFAPLDSSLPFQSHTTLSATGSRNGLSFTLREDLQIIARRPSRYHVKLIQYNAAGTTAKQLAVVWNGINVWTYQPSTHRYSITSLQGFEDADSDIPTLGLIVGGFYLGDGRPMIQGFHNLTADNSADVLAALSKMDITLSRQAQSVKGHDDYVYSMTLVKQNLAYQFYVDTQTNKLTRIDLTIAQDGLQITFREDIARIGSLSILPKSAFVFLPPLRTSQAASVSATRF
ncbi:MAG: hypothetical protein ACRYFS_00450 [Janthinobacterium lividum]